MKNTYACFLFSLLFASQMAAQAPGNPAFPEVRMGIALGGDIEMPHQLGHAYLLSTAKNMDFDVSQLPFEDGELVAMECDNGTARFTFSVVPKGAKTAELQFSLLSIEGRIDQVHYTLPEEGHYLDVNAKNEEFALEGVFLKRDQVNRTFTFFGGLGTNVGYSHGGEVRITGFLKDSQLTDDPEIAQEVDHVFQQKDGINQRLFLQAGMGIRFLKVMEFGLECRKGFGYRASFDGPFRMTTLKRSIGFSLKYVFR